MKGMARWVRVGLALALAGLVLTGGRGFRAEAQSGSNVELVGQVGGSIWAVAVQGRYAYVGVGPRLVVMDVGDPSRPVVVGRTGVLPGVVRGVAVSGSYAYVADGGLRVIDVSNPAAPREVGFYDTLGWALGVAVSGSYAYVADGNKGLRVIDVSNPAAPREVGVYDTPGGAEDVAVSGSYAYVADGSGGLVILRFLGFRVYLPLVMHNYR
ncbi:LVIVD repeat-containing protein [Thermoflexus hugenholtzii]